MSIGSLVGKLGEMGLTGLGDAVAGPLGGVALGWIGHLFGLGPKPDTSKVLDAINADPQNAQVKLQQLQNEKAEELALLQEQATQVTQTNQTLRSYLASTDPFVRRAPAFFFYIAALSFGATILAIVGGVVGSVWAAGTGHAKLVSDLTSGVSALVQSTVVIWGVALPVLGVVRTKDSHDRQVAAGQEPSTLLGALAKRLAGGK